MSLGNDVLPVLAIIVPCYNEDDVLAYTRDELTNALSILENKEIISRNSFIAFIDDGSIDKTWERIREYNSQFPHKIKGLKLSRNFGHQNALMSGMFSFNFDICVTMDADLQDPPNAISKMIDKFKEGYEIVYGVRSKRDKDSFFKLITARLFYVLMAVLGVNTVSDHADFRLLSRRVVDTLRNFKEVNLFLRGIIPYLGFNSSVVYYERDKRKAGKTKYPLKKMLAFAWDGITSFSIVPIRIITFSGFIIFILSLLISVYSLIARYLGQTIPGWTSLALSLYILGGLTIFFLGINGEYIGKIYMEVKQRPVFIVEKIIQ